MARGTLMSLASLCPTDPGVRLDVIDAAAVGVDCGVADAHVDPVVLGLAEGLQVQGTGRPEVPVHAADAGLPAVEVRVVRVDIEHEDVLDVELIVAGVARIRVVRPGQGRRGVGILVFNELRPRDAVILGSGGLPRRGGRARGRLRAYL